MGQVETGAEAKVQDAKVLAGEAEKGLGAGGGAKGFCMGSGCCRILDSHLADESQRQTQGRAERGLEEKTLLTQVEAAVCNTPKHLAHVCHRRQKPLVLQKQAKRRCVCLCVCVRERDGWRQVWMETGATR